METNKVKYLDLAGLTDLVKNRLVGRRKGKGEVFNDIFSNNSLGLNSHAEGTGTIANNDSEHAQGKYNKSNSGNDLYTKTLHSIGIGVDDTNRKNAVEVTADGSVYIDKVGEYDGTNLLSADGQKNKKVKSVQEVINAGGGGTAKLPDLIAEPVEMPYQYTLGENSYPVYQQLIEGFYENKTKDEVIVKLQDLSEGKTIIPLTYSGFYRYEHDTMYHPVTDSIFKIGLNGSDIHYYANEQNIFYKIIVTYFITDYVPDPYYKYIEHGIYLNEFTFDSEQLIGLTVNGVEQTVPAPKPKFADVTVNTGTDSTDIWNEKASTLQGITSFDYTRLTSDITIKTTADVIPTSIIFRTPGVILKNSSSEPVDTSIINISDMNHWISAEDTGLVKIDDKTYKISLDAILQATGVSIQQLMSDGQLTLPTGDWMALLSLFGNLQICFSSQTAVPALDPDYPEYDIYAEFVAPDPSKCLPTEISYEIADNGYINNSVIDNGLISGAAKWSAASAPTDLFDFLKYTGIDISQPEPVEGAPGKYFDCLKQDRIILKGDSNEVPEGLVIRLMADFGGPGGSEVQEMPVPFSEPQYQMFINKINDKNEYSFNLFMASYYIAMLSVQGQKFDYLNISLCKNITSNPDTGDPQFDLIPTALYFQNDKPAGSLVSKDLNTGVSTAEYIYLPETTIISAPNGDLLGYKYDEGIENITKRTNMSELHFSTASTIPEINTPLLKENGLSNLRSLDFPSTLKTIEIGSFVGLCNLSQIVFRSSVPPTITGTSYKTPNETLDIVLPEGKTLDDYKADILTPFSWNYANVSIMPNIQISDMWVNDSKGMFRCEFYVPKKSKEIYKQWLIDLIHLDPKYSNVKNITEIGWSIKDVNDYNENETDFIISNIDNRNALKDLIQAGVFSESDYFSEFGGILYKDYIDNYMLCGNLKDILGFLGTKIDLNNINPETFLTFKQNISNIFNIKYNSSEFALSNIEKLLRNLLNPNSSLNDRMNKTGKMYIYKNNKWSYIYPADQYSTDSNNSYMYSDDPLYFCLLPPFIDINDKLDNYYRVNKDVFAIKSDDSDYLKKAIKKLYDLNVIKSPEGITYNEFDTFYMNYDTRYKLVKTISGELKLSNQALALMDNAWKASTRAHKGERFHTQNDKYVDSIFNSNVLYYDEIENKFKSINIAHIDLTEHPEDAGELTNYNEMLLLGLAAKDNSNSTKEYSKLLADSKLDNPYILEASGPVLSKVIPSLYKAGLISSPKGITQQEYNDNYMYYSPNGSNFHASAGLGVDEYAWKVDRYGVNDNVLHPYYVDYTDVIAWDNNTGVWRCIASCGTDPHTNYVWEGRESGQDHGWTKSDLYDMTRPLFTISLESHPYNGPYASGTTYPGDPSLNPSPQFMKMLQYVEPHV